MIFFLQKLSLYLHGYPSYLYDSKMHNQILEKYVREATTRRSNCTPNCSPVNLTCFIVSAFIRECSGSEVECLTQDLGVAGLSLTGDNALCPGARHINLCLVLVQLRKTCPDITE